MEQQQQRRLKLLNIPNHNVFGIRRVNKRLFIGNEPVKVQDDGYLAIKDEKFELTSGLLNLLTQTQPAEYSVVDLGNYKFILLLTNAHRQQFNHDRHITSSKSWKYVNIISKLFPPIRKSTNLCKRKLIMSDENSPPPGTDEQLLNDNDDEKSSPEYDYTNEQRVSNNSPLEYDDINELVDRLYVLDQTQGKKEDIFKILRELERLEVVYKP